MRSRLNGVRFSFYSPDEIKKMSVKEINNPIAFDTLNRPIRGGLYDPALGVSPYDRYSMCETCGQESISCPGHIGHIELILPLYNPFLMNLLHKLLKSQCQVCHKLKIPDIKLKAYERMFLLIKLGYVIEKRTFYDLSFSKYAKQQLNLKSSGIDLDTTIESEASTGTLKTEQASSKPSILTSRKVSEYSNDVETIKKTQKQPEEFEAIYNISQIRQTPQERLKFKEELDEKCNDHNKNMREAILRLLNVKKFDQKFRNGVQKTQAMVIELKETLKDLWGAVNMQKCPHCGNKSSNIMKDGFTKFFLIQKSEQEKDLKTIASKKKCMDSEDEQSHESDGQEDEESRRMQVDGFQKNEKEKKQQYLSPLAVYESVKLLFKKHKKLLSLIFGELEINQSTLHNTKKGYKLLSNNESMFFVELVPVTPNRFRPENKLSDQTFLHGHTVQLTKILQLNQEIKDIILLQKMNETDPEAAKLFLKKLDMRKHVEFTDTIKKWIELQDAVNTFYDSSKSIKSLEKDASGIKQLLEKKEGMFRMKMMGKRVNYAARSVISPDPYLDTNEVGVPLFMAKKLTYPEPVNEYNVEKLRTRIENGPFVYPGANFIEENGQKISLEFRSQAQRRGIARTLLNNCENKVVYRHLESGDVVLFNRQPTLHKPSLMSHIVRVLPKEQTIRMHYANCNSYNADFDGDEMNLHFLQNNLARTEAYMLQLTDKQYIVPTSGKPIRGLIQDSIFSAVFLGSRDTFLTKEDYCQLVYSATWNLLKINNNSFFKIKLLQPAVIKPVQLWTGKQVISTVLRSLVEYQQDKTMTTDRTGINCEGKCKLDPGVWGQQGQEETYVIVRDSELLTGVLDKNHIGNADFGLVHAFYELYGPELTGTLLTCFSRLFTVFLQMHGFTCGLDDLILEETENLKRTERIEAAHLSGVQAVSAFVKLNPDIPSTLQLANRPTFKLNKKGKRKDKVLKREPYVDYLPANNPISKALEKKLIYEKTAAVDLDKEVKMSLNKPNTDINSSIPHGLKKHFPQNLFGVMIMTGAKGSKVNQTQVSSMLGQQELEGRRVPLMPSGKSLPSFISYDPNPRAGGYITDRFLTGVRPQDFYFHCMAGREGLIDTAVKTARSGYLQRCLIKHMESLIVNYDYSVRDSDGTVVQFIYGEDGLDPCKVSYIDKHQYLLQNYEGLLQKYNPEALADCLDQKEVKDYLKKRNKSPEEYEFDTILNNYFPGTHLGAISEKARENCLEFINKNKDILKENKHDVTKNKFLTLYQIKYFFSLISPGDCVGAIAAQSVGEPSTQMTLNTFHLAGHGGANVTLGIPRLREILMTASREIKTPTMLLSFKRDDITYTEAEIYARKLEKLRLIELIKSVEVHETKKLTKNGKILVQYLRNRQFQIQIEFEDLEAIEATFDLPFEVLKQKVESSFIPALIGTINKQLKKSNQSNYEIDIRTVKQFGGGSMDVEEGTKKSGKGRKKSDEEAEDEQYYKDEIQELEDIYNPKDDLVLGKIEEEQDFEGIKDKNKLQSDNNTQQQKQQQNELKYSNVKQTATVKEYLEKIEWTNQGVNILLKLPLDSKKLLMINLIERVTQNVLMYETQGINRCFLQDESKGKNSKPIYKIQTEGVNFMACWVKGFVDENTIDCNDIYAILTIYGVEAARNAIVKEIRKVFDAYGIVVNVRHLYLIADYMTNNGDFKAMNRKGMEEGVSPFLKMSFETTMAFLTHSTLHNEMDENTSPSSNIVLGRVPKVGTGMFDILHRLI